MALGVAGCVVSPVGSLSDFATRGGANSFEAFERLPGADALVLDVPFDRQENRIACGAHVLASVIRYWRPSDTVTGKSIFAAHPPADLKTGYSMQELIGLAGEHGLSAYGARIAEADIIAELEKGRPVLVPVLVPGAYELSGSLFDPDPPVMAQLKAWYLGTIGSVNEAMKAGLLAHYVLVVGHSADRFVLLDPVLGYRTIANARLARYRASYEGASLIFSMQPKD